jgi:hypothetical protein
MTRKIWSGREDLNFRPQRPERCALTRLREAGDFHFGNLR